MFFFLSHLHLSTTVTHISSLKKVLKKFENCTYLLKVCFFGHFLPCTNFAPTFRGSTKVTIHRGRKGIFNSFSKNILNKVFLMIEIARELKFYTRMVASGSKSIKKGQKMLKKATIWSYLWFF